ncbi:cytochrome P450 [Sparassis latifolia]
MARDGWDFQLDVSQNYGPVVNITGFMTSPMLYVYDPKALQSIILQDQDIYEESPTFIHANQMCFGPSLVATVGDVHRKQRKMLNPAFSIAHMRRVLPIFYKVVGRLHTAINARVNKEATEVDMLAWMGRTALELIGQGGLGYSFDPLVEDATDEYADALKAFLTTSYSFGLIRFAAPYISQFGTPAFRRRLLKVIPSRRVHEMVDIVDTMYRKSTEIFNAKKAALQRGDETAILQQIGEGRDIMSILLKANMEAKSEEDRLPEEHLLAQMSTFTFAATDTTSNTLARIFELLAEHPDVQERLRNEILREYNGAELSYDQLMQLPYLDAVCRETLRVYPPATLLHRQVRNDVILPLSAPIRGRDGKMISEIPIPNGTKLFIGIAGSNLNKALWGEDALEWKPDRWLSPLPSALTDARIPGVYSNLMSFLGGGRACIGFKFSELEMKVVLAVLLPNFTFEPTGKPIVWNIAGVQYPTVGNESTRAEMPLKVGLYKNSCS